MLKLPPSLPPSLTLPAWPPPLDDQLVRVAPDGEKYIQDLRHLDLHGSHLSILYHKELAKGSPSSRLWVP